MRDRPLFIPGISGAGEKATQQVQSLKAGVLAQGKPSEISSYGLFCAMSLSLEVSFLASKPGKSRNGREGSCPCLPCPTRNEGWGPYLSLRLLYRFF